MDLSCKMLPTVSMLEYCSTRKGSWTSLHSKVHPQGRSMRSTMERRYSRLKNDNAKCLDVEGRMI